MITGFSIYLPSTYLFRSKEYQRHDENCDPAVDLPANLADKDPNVTYKPSFTEATDVYGNTYRNYNADYESN